MDSASRSSKVLEDDDDDDEEFGKGDGSSLKGLAVKCGGRNSDHKANTPRSKHSATEQRRRSKINDRFQILRGLLPNSDQKRDKASFLLEVIEYIRFLQEKVEKYESMYPGWSDESAKMMSWEQNNHRITGDVMADVPVMKNGSAPGFIISDNGVPVSPVILSAAQNPIESDLLAGRGAGLCQPQQTFISESHHVGHRSSWLRTSSPADCTISNNTSNEYEELTIDEGTINISCAYSQGLLNNMSEALQNSGINLSQASISVQINLGKKAKNRIPNVSASMSLAKDVKDAYVMVSIVMYCRDVRKWSTGEILVDCFNMVGDESVLWIGWKYGEVR
ncbi:Transcription factor BIM2 [Apostasia shenzhenica]|uniref:Transcription factor BIM2 n=1 Tax=Apostasia shenzhenica TaxID=1088818 RepID=A0A2I0AWA6_9ASPA|nr:Transcription factor BIM2 [Apostasia shenzhenica]